MASAKETADSTGRKRRGPYANGLERRQELVAQSLNLFAEHGFQRLSLRKIAETLGMSHAALSYYFPSKEDLLRAVFEEQARREQPLFQPLIDQRGLLDVLAELVSRNNAIPGLISLDVSLLGEAHQVDHFAHDWAQQRITDGNALLKSELVKEHERGRLRAGLDLDVTARQLNALVRGLQLQWLYDPELPVDAHINAYIDLIRA
ncbi:hypothetical protein ASF17_14145 [Frigoribacterium sp. Leaf263]|uniref:TetR/AcrR family transcriptional regulator n=1 Tax=Frigoribacterium sp. Leaf263 TaxID=1736313 RepID=UPI0006F68633|nr:TetR/AcrR family transcriptional regulator [Frigoribacterium sp. Leaf263]KQO80438.1 hypothetical protein ASF17_14145 [Frigoribacterium sp. Leaf263]